jgi:hypothetical protein
MRNWFFAAQQSRPREAAAMGERLLAISPFSDTGWIALQYGPLAPTIDAWLTADREYFAFLSTHLMNIPEAEQK